MLVKMMIFPKYLFLFRTAPLNITTTLLKTWQRSLSEFVFWKWLLFNLMTASKADGGLALPHLKMYYETTVLSTLLKHYSKNYQAAWKEVEDHDFCGKAFQEVLWMTQRYRTKSFTPSLLCSTTLKVWDVYRKVLTKPNSLLRPFLGQEWFKPGIHPSSFKLWHEHGLTRFCDVAPKGQLLEKQKLDDICGVQLQWLEYLQLAHLFQRSVDSTAVSTTLTDFEKLMKSETLPKAGLISLVYKCLLGLWNQPAYSFQRAWETELHQQITDDMWRSSRNSATFHSRFTNVQMAAYKIDYRWHLTPVRLHRIHPHILETCWKGCGETGTYVHCLWSCPRLQPLYNLGSSLYRTYYGLSNTKEAGFASLKFMGDTQT